MGAAQAGGLILGVAVILACHLLRVRPALPLIVLLATLLMTGLLSTSQVPGIAQVADAKQGLEHWRDRQIAINHAANEQLAAVETALGGSSGADCPEGSS